MKHLILPLLTTASLLAWPAAAADDARVKSAFEARLESELGVASGLTSQQVADRALDTSFDVAARKSELDAAAADSSRALLGYLPDVTVAASYTRLSDIGVQSIGNLVAAPTSPLGPLDANALLVNVPIELTSLLNQYVLQANLLVPVSDYFLRVAPARSAAEHARFAASKNVETTRARVVTDARVAYYAWVRARLAVVVAEQTLEDAKGHVADARVSVAAGAASPVDVLRLESQVARSELFLANARTFAAVNEEQVRTSLHENSNRELAIGEDVRTPLADALNNEAARVPELVREALQNRPELESARQNALALSDRARFDRAGYVPRLDAYAGATYANPNPRIFPPVEEFRGTWQIGARLGWDLTEIPSARLAAKASEARSAAALSDRALLTDRIRVEVRAAAQAIDEATVALSSTQQGLRAAEESYRVRRLSFQNGRSTSIELLDAETDLTRSRLERLNAHVDARIARARLAYAVGRALPKR